MPTIDISRYNIKKTVAKQPAFSVAGLLNKEMRFGSSKVSDKKKEAFYLELSTLLQSGLDLKTALELILVEQEKAKDKALFERVKNDVLEGSSLSESIKKAKRFSDYEFYSVRIGEETGRLGEVLADLAAYFKSKIQQRRKIISAITYPAIVMLTSFGAVFFMIQFVVPMFGDVFLRFGGDLPWITKTIISISQFSKSYFLYFILTFGAALITLYQKRNTAFFREVSSKLILKTPVAGELIRKIYLARFANTMRLLVSTDTPLLSAIGLVKQMIGFFPIENSLMQVEQDILKGESLHNSLSKFPFYPPKLVQLIKVGEEVNRLDYFFEKISIQYTEEVEYKTNTISSLLEPLIIIFLGLVVGVILIAMYLPMFQLSNSF